MCTLYLLMYTMVHMEISEQRKEREERDVGLYCKGPFEFILLSSMFYSPYAHGI